MTRARQTSDWGSRAGLAKIVPSSVAVGSGTGSADSLGNVTFSGASSVSLNDVFSSIYDTYRIIVDCTGSTALATSFRFRVSGADNSTANYQRQSIYNSAATTVAAFRTASDTSWSVVNVPASTARSNFIIDFTSSPFASIRKGAISYACDSYSTTTPGLVLASYGFNDTTSFTGFSILTSTGNITGTIRVYGYTQ